MSGAAEDRREEGEELRGDVREVGDRDVGIVSWIAEQGVELWRRKGVQREGPRLTSREGNARRG